LLPAVVRGATLQPEDAMLSHGPRYVIRMVTGGTAT